MFLVGLLTACSSSNTSTADGGNQIETQSEESSNQTENNEVEVKAEEKDDSNFKVTLLGTGTPLPQITRFGASTLVEVGGEKLLFDAGRGSSIRLSQLGYTPGEIDKLFITHLHHDHTVGFPDILISGSVPHMGGRQEAFQVWGPSGTQNMIDGFYQAYEKDVENRQNVTNAASNGLDTKVHEIEEGVIYNNNGIEVIAFKVDHGSMEPAFGFRVNYDGRSVVISGDTTYNENLIEHAKGTDLIIHEVVAHPESDTADLSDSMENIKSYHTTPEQAAEVFKQVNPKMAAYTHIISLGVEDGDIDYIERTNEIYDGKVVLGEDLMTFEIGDEIEVKRPDEK